MQGATHLTAHRITTKDPASGQLPGSRFHTAAGFRLIGSQNRISVYALSFSGTAVDYQRQGGFFRWKDNA